LNTKEYISSGILEAYALGELSIAERHEVEQNLSLYPELREELQLIEEAQEKFLLSVAIQPQDSVKKKLFDQIQTENTGVIITEKATHSGDNISIWKYSLAASFALTLIASFMAYNYYGKWRTSETSLNELIAQNQRMASEYNAVNQRLDKIEADIKVIDNPAFKRTVMNGTTNAPEAMAYVYWNESTREVYLSIQNMKELSRENQYQLWAIVDGKPVNAGVFDGNLSGLLKMKEMTGAAAFAVTVEPRGGKASPTLETMQVIGNVVKG
jgi:anti-sigma-K factor RskA